MRALLVALRRARFWWLACAALLVVVAAISLSWRDQAVAQSQNPATIVPENRVGVGEIVPIAAALSYYASIAPASDPAESQPGTCAGNSEGRHAQVRELARALPPDADAIFAFVRDNVEFEATFGLKKGAAGAVLDGDGNAFDQAQLLVELLRANNICARYVFGTAEASLAQLQNWLGVADIDAAERYFADGGIPVERNGGNLRFAHVWVQLYGASGSTAYDPSFKTRRQAPAAVDLANVIGLNATALRSALGGTGSVTASRTYAATTSFDSYLTSEAQELSALLYSNTAPAGMPAQYNGIDFTSRSLNDLFGIGEIEPLANAALSAAMRMPLTAYPAQHLTWYDVPDRFRTFVSIRLGLLDGTATEPNWHIEQFVPLDVAANTRLWINTTFQGHASPSQFSTGRLRLMMDQAVVDETPDLSSDEETEHWFVSIDVAQPYAANSGSYLDTHSIGRIDARSTSVIFLSSGRSSTRRNDELSRTPLPDIPLQRNIWIGGNQAVNSQLCFVPQTTVRWFSTYREVEACVTITTTWSGDSMQMGESSGTYCTTLPEWSSWGSFSDFYSTLQPCSQAQIGADASVEGTPQPLFSGQLITKLRAANSWLYQAGRARAVTAGVAHGLSQNHTTVGIVTSSLQVEPYHNSVTGDQLRINAESTLSFNRRAGAVDPTARAAMGGAYAAAANALEGFVLQNAVGSPIGGSVASRFRWSIAFDDPGSGLNFRNVATGPDGAFRQITAADLAAQGAAIWNGTVQYELARQIIERQLDEGYIAFIPTWGSLGPEVATEQRRERPPNISELDWYNNVYRRGSAAIILYNPTTGSIAHLLFDPVLGAFKGGGVTPELRGSEIRRPTPDDLDNSADPWSRLIAVDDREGRLTLTPPPDISFGGSPLVYQRTYQSELAATRHFASGWRDNHFNELNVSGGAAAQFGDERPAHAAAMLVAIMSALKLHEGALDIDTVVGSQLAAGWWTDGMLMSAVTATHGVEQTSYYRAPNGTWLGETPRAGTLTQTGQIVPVRRATIFDDPLIPSISGPHPDNAVRISFDFDITGAAFVERAPDGRVRRWTPQQSWSPGPSAAEMQDLNSMPPQQPNGGVGLTFCDETIGNAPCGVPPYSWFALTQVQEGCPPGGVADPSLCRGVTLTYDLQNNTVSDNLGNWINLASLTASSGVSLQATWQAPPAGYQGGAALTSMQYRQNGATLWEQRYQYENAHGASSTISYQPLLNRVFLPADHTNPYLQIAYTADDRIDFVTRANGQTWNYFATGRRSEVRDPTGAAAIQWFDRYGRQIVSRDRAGRVSLTTNDGAGRVISVRSRSASTAVGSHDEAFDYAYDRFDNVTVQQQLARTGFSDPAIEVRTAYELADYPTLPTTVTQEMGALSDRVTVNTYDPYGRLKQVDGPAGERSDYFYDTLGFPTETRLWVDQTNYRRTQFDYTHDSQPHRGLIRRVTVTPAPPDASAPIVSTFGWNAHGDLTGVTDPRGNFTAASYDGARRMIQLDRRMGGSGAALAARTTFEYDLNSRLRFVRELTEPTGNDWATSEARYTPTGRLERVIDPALDADVFSYDARDWLFSATDGASRRTEYVYDPAGRLTCERRGVGTGDVQAYRSLAHAFWDAPTRYRPARGSNGDAACTQVTANYDTNVSLDAYGRVRTTTFPDGTTTIEERNLAGEVTTFTNRANQQHAMTYDNSGRVLTRTTPEGTFAFQYNRAGEQTRAAFDPVGAEPERWTQFVYDGFGRLKTEQRWDGLNVGYEYDPASNRTAIVWPDNWRAEYVYDPLNRLIEVRGGALGAVATLARYAYDARSRRTSAAFGPTLGAPVSSIAYLWEIDNDLDALTHVFNGASVAFDHGYDGSGRVTSTAVSNDDWLWRPAVASSESYGAANVLDQYPSVAGQTLSWDQRGNLAAWGTLALTHDSANRLTGASRTGVFSATYSYDGLDRRIARTGSGTNVAQVRFVHAGAEEIAEYHPTTNTVLRRYVPGAGIDQPVAYVEHVGGTQLYYYHQDRLGNIVALANASGALAERYLYTPYGVEEPLVSTGQPFRYTARRFDAESALYYYRARYYSPQLGRFLQTDPIGFEQELNLYSYTANDPLNRVDPSGMLWGKAIRRVLTRLADDMGEAAARRAVRLELRRLREAGIREAWRQERILVQRTGRGTREWTEAERAELLREGKVSGYGGHHRNAVQEYPEQASDPNNIEFLRTGRGEEHMNLHREAGGTHVPTTGEPINRSQLLLESTGEMMPAPPNPVPTWRDFAPVTAAGVATLEFLGNLACATDLTCAPDLD